MEEEGWEETNPDDMWVISFLIRAMLHSKNASYKVLPSLWHCTCLWKNGLDWMAKLGQAYWAAVSYHTEDGMATFSDGNGSVYWCTEVFNFCFEFTFTCLALLTFTRGQWWFSCKKKKKIISYIDSKSE